MTAYHVDVTRDDRWWMLRFPELDDTNGLVGEAITQARRFADIEVEARDYIAVVTGAEPSAITLDVRAVLDGMDLTAVHREIEAARAEIDTARQRIEDRQRQVVAGLSAAGVPVRDIGAVLGVSYQRAHQLAS